MRIWLDDERPMPANYDTHVKTAPEAIALLATGKVERISLDYYLGSSGQGTGCEVAEAIRDMARDGKIPPIRMGVHTSSQEWRYELAAILRDADQHWKERKD